MYKTKQRENILNILKNNSNRCLSGKEIIEKLGINASKATVYRTLDMLCSDNIVGKFFNDKSGSYDYQYIGREQNCNEHLHLKCLICGDLIHLKCKVSNELIEHILKEHSFKIDQKTSVLYGVCNKCQMVVNN